MSFLSSVTNRISSLFGNSSDTYDPKTVYYRNHKEMCLEHTTCTKHPKLAEEECAVCLEKIGNDQEQQFIYHIVEDQEKTLSIDKVQKHIFHKECLSPWIAKHDSCPTCKQKITPHIPDLSYLQRVQRSIQLVIRNNSQTVINTTIIGGAILGGGFGAAIAGTVGSIGGIYGATAVGSAGMIAGGPSLLFFGAINGAIGGAKGALVGAIYGTFAGIKLGLLGSVKVIEHNADTLTWWESPEIAAEGPEMALVREEANITY